MRKTRHRLIPGCIGYMVGDDGSFWSKHIPGVHKKNFRLGEWKRLNPRPSKDGYYEVCVRPAASEVVRDLRPPLQVNESRGLLPCPVKRAELPRLLSAESRERSRETPARKDEGADFAE